MGKKRRVWEEASEEQRAELLAYAAEKGADWKRRLAADWLHAAARVNGEHSGLLQQVRNELGPEWLFSFEAPEERAAREAAKKAARKAKRAKVPP